MGEGSERERKGGGDLVSDTEAKEKDKTSLLFIEHEVILHNG